MKEPVLDSEDVRLWDMWQRTARVHASTRLHQRRVDAAVKAIDEALAAVDGDACVMWSGGKDSTALTHLACVESAHQLRVYSEKDDLDYPGERRYVESLAGAWKVDLQVLEPATSPRKWAREHATLFTGDNDLHSRTAELSKLFFYPVVEAAGRSHRGILLGLRSDESRGRRLNRAKRGLWYRKEDGQVVGQPIADWSGLDVMAYLAKRYIDPLPVYRCIGFDLDHVEAPWLIRKSWWIPGQGGRKGQVAWLRRYWPSLYRELIGFAPWARGLS